MFLTCEPSKHAKSSSFGLIHKNILRQVCITLTFDYIQWEDRPEPIFLF